MYQGQQQKESKLNEYTPRSKSFQYPFVILVNTGVARIFFFSLIIFFFFFLMHRLLIAVASLAAEPRL